MRAVIIDDEYPAINELSYLLQKYNVEVIGTFISPMEGYNFLLKERPEVVFLDIRMPQYNGIELGVNIRQNLPMVTIVYITAYSHYALTSYKAYPVDYILKPIDETRLVHTIDYIQNRLNPTKNYTSLKIQCFGKFKVLTGDEEVKFPTQKTRELLAYLLCNHKKVINKDDLLDEIFESGDKSKNLNNLRVTLFRLRNVFMETKINKEDLLIRNDYSLYIPYGICDLIDFRDFMDKNKIINKQNINDAVKFTNIIKYDFLSDIDTLWVYELREYFLFNAEELLMKVGLYYIEAEADIANAELYFNRVIVFNPLSEPGYMALLDLFIQIKSVDKFAFTYITYSKLLRDELGCIPEERFIEYYKQHIG